MVLVSLLRYGKNQQIGFLDTRTRVSAYVESVHQQVEVGFGPPQPATWSYHDADCQPTAPVPLVSLVQSAGTLYRTI